LALSNAGAAAQLAVKGRQRVQELFTWERVVDQLEALYKRVYDAQQKSSLKTLTDAEGQASY
jgi:glycosyltransferase involved in cell wall biosynthesis